MIYTGMRGACTAHYKIIGICRKLDKGGTDAYRKN